MRDRRKQETRKTLVRRGRSHPDASARSPRRTALLFAVAIGLFACGADTPEDRLAEARESLSEARAAVQSLEAKVEERREAVQQAEEAAAKERAQLDEARNELAQARNRIDERATQVALFRTVQGELLAAESLHDFAIRVDVSGGTVTLRGQVAKPEHAREAVEIARGVPGVAEVVDELTVQDAGGTGS